MCVSREKTGRWEWFKHVRANPKGIQPTRELTSRPAAYSRFRESSEPINKINKLKQKQSTKTQKCFGSTREWRYREGQIKPDRVIWGTNQRKKAKPFCRSEGRRGNKRNRYFSSRPLLQRMGQMSRTPEGVGSNLRHPRPWRFLAEGEISLSFRSNRGFLRRRGAGQGVLQGEDPIRRSPLIKNESGSRHREGEGAIAREEDSRIYSSIRLT